MTAQLLKLLKLPGCYNSHSGKLRAINKQLNIDRKPLCGLQNPLFPAVQDQNKLQTQLRTLNRVAKLLRQLNDQRKAFYSKTSIVVGTNLEPDTWGRDTSIYAPKDLFLQVPLNPQHCRGGTPIFLKGQHSPLVGTHLGDFFPCKVIGLPLSCSKTQPGTCWAG